jgi:hypothetical protein
MSDGAPYPKLPLPSGIGKGFQIGVSPIGTPPPFNYWDTILSQYANSAILTQLISNFFQYLDQTANLDAFFSSIWDIDTATGRGLEIWGRIVGVTRTLRLITGKFFGFDEATTVSADPFGQSPFFSGTLLTSNFDLTDDSFRTLIFAKALANISDGSIPSINQILLNLFPGRGNCFVVDNGNMSLTYTFQFVLSAVETAIVTQSGVLPKPVGVAAAVSIIAGGSPTIPLPPAPFVKTDWPLPTRRPHPHGLRTHLKAARTIATA